MSRILTLAINPNPILRKKSLIVKPEEIKALKSLALNMQKTMLKNKGIGLAAPQVGKNIRLIIINTKNGFLTMFNPQINFFSKKQEIGEEGCLSVPETFGNVERSCEIRVVYLNEKAELIQLQAQGMLARVIQHETDHLNGILFIDKLVN